MHRTEGVGMGLANGRWKGRHFPGTHAKSREVTQSREESRTQLWSVTQSGLLRSAPPAVKETKAWP